MKLKYILLSNDSCSNSTQNFSNAIDHDSLISYLFSNCQIHSINQNGFFLDYNNATYNLTTLLQYETQTNTIYLTLEISTDTDDESASILNYLRTEINNLSRDTYYIICSLDESSEYYCNKIYPLFNLCERRLRSITYSFITKAFGYQWYDKTFDDDQKDGLKEKLKIKQKPQRTIALIENSLYELTWFELIDYLFQVQAFKNLDTTLTPDLLKTKSKEDLLEIIEECRPQTKWEKYIMPLPKDFSILECLNILRTHRNNVAHNKIFTQDDYIYCSTHLPKVISLINAGDTRLKELLFTNEQQSEIICDTYSTFLSLAPFGAYTSETMKPIADAIKALSDNMKITGLSTSQLASLASFGTYTSETMEPIADAINTLSDNMKIAGLSTSQLASLASFGTYTSELMSPIADVINTLSDNMKMNGLSPSQLTLMTSKSDKTQN